MREPLWAAWIVELSGRKFDTRTSCPQIDSRRCGTTAGTDFTPQRSLSLSPWVRWPDDEGSTGSRRLGHAPVDQPSTSSTAI